jgi:hypothetical protein
MKLALPTSPRGEYLGVRRTRLIDERAVRIFLGAAAVVVIVVSVLTYLLETTP